MRKKFLSGLMAATLIVTMLGSTVFAGEVKEQGVETDVDVAGSVVWADSIFDVILPTTVYYAIDPEKRFEGEQIISGEYGVINHSTDPIQLDVKPYLTVTSASIIIGDFDTVSAAANDSTVTKPALYLALAATDATPQSLSLSTTSAIGAEVATYAAVSFGTANLVTTTPAAVITTATDTTVSFALDKAPYELVTSGTLTGASMEAHFNPLASVVNDDAIGFSLTGMTNDVTEWSKITAGTNLGISLKFSFTRLSNKEYAATEKGVNGCHGLMAGSGSTEPDVTITNVDYDGDKIWFDLPSAPTNVRVVIGDNAPVTKPLIAGTGADVGSYYFDSADWENSTAYALMNVGDKLYKVELY